MKECMRPSSVKCHNIQISLIKIHMDGEEYNNDLHGKNVLVVLNIYTVNLGKNRNTETKVPDRTKDGRDGKNAVVSEPKPNRNDWERTVCGKQRST